MRGEGARGFPGARAGSVVDFRVIQGAGFKSRRCPRLGGRLNAKPRQVEVRELLTKCVGPPLKLGQDKHLHYDFCKYKHTCMCMYLANVGHSTLPIV